MAPQNRVEVEQIGKATLVRINYEQVMDDGTMDELKEQLESAVETGMCNLALDFRKVNMLASVFLGFLAKFQSRIQKAGGKLALFGCSPHVREVFTITQLDRIIKICDTEDAAFKAIE